MNIKKNADVRKTGILSIDNSVNYIREYYNTIAKQLSKEYKQRILFLGSTNPCFFGFYEHLRNAGETLDFVWMRYKKKYAEVFTHGFIIKIPKDISRVNYHLLTEETKLSYEEIQRVESNPYFKWAFDNIMCVHPYDNPNCVRKMILLSEQYFINVYTLMNPSAIIIWNPYVSFNKIAEYVAREKGICVIFAESGVIPGTLAFSTWGDLGESRPSIEYGNFMKLLITENDKKLACDIIVYLQESKFNRNIQPRTENRYLLCRKRPVIFLAGQNDSECGLQPYDEKAKKYSPVFDSSEASLLFLAELALRNDWNIIYKPHPIVARRMLEKKTVPDNVIYITEGDINDIVDLCDVCVTILSTTAYVALIREKPVVMLGKIQLNGQGCSYEAFEKDKIEEKIVDALKYGYTKEQKYAFVEHVARMCKYYLYDSLQPRGVHYGQPIENAVAFVERAINGRAEF